MVAVLKEVGADVQRIRVLVGGGSVSDLWNQIRADVTRTPFERAKVTEGTATGIALLTGLGIGLYQDWGKPPAGSPRLKTFMSPMPPTGCFMINWGEVQEKVYEALCESFKELEEIRGMLSAGS